MAVPRVEKAYEKHAWIIFFAFGVILLIFALVGIIRPDLAWSDLGNEKLTGTTWSQLVASTPWVADLFVWQYRALTVVALLGFVLTIAISLNSYRRGEKWAWYAFWIWPVFAGLEIALHTGIGLSPLRPILGLIIILLGLFLPYRKFFPRK